MYTKIMTEKYLAAKAAEEIAKQARLQAESDLIMAIRNDKPEGTKTVMIDGYKISVANKLTRKLDHEKYLEIRDSLPEALRFVTYKPEISVTVLRHLEAIDPKLAAVCVTTKPSKPSIEIKEVL